jgi:hypothetical protein
MKSSYIALAAVGLALGGLWYAAGSGAGPEPTPAAAAEQPRVSAPATHDNLTVYFIHGPDTTTDEKVVTLQEALEKKWVVVHETGNVNVLAVENLSDDHDLFLQSGDMVKGGKQDRIVSTDLLVPPKSGKVALPAHCVEQSRWRQRKPGEAADRFHSSDGQACGKDLKAANIRQNQGEVWKEVAGNQTKLSRNVGENVNCPESPSSLQLALDNRAVRMKADAYVAALKDRSACGPNVVGVVFVVNGQVSGAEVYGSTTLFKKAWPKLLKSAAEEALADRTSGPCAPAPTCREVELFLANATKPDDAAATGRGDEVMVMDIPDSPERGQRGRNADQSGRGNRGGGRDPLAQTEERAAQTSAIPGGGFGRPQNPGYLAGNNAPNNPAVGYPYPNGGPAGQQQGQTQLSAVQVDNVRVLDNVGRSPRQVYGNRTVTRAVTQPVTQPAGNGNQLDVTRGENSRVLMLEARNPAQPSAPVIHRSLITK